MHQTKTSFVFLLRQMAKAKFVWGYPPGLILQEFLVNCWVRMKSELFSLVGSDRPFGGVALIDVRLVKREICSSVWMWGSAEDSCRVFMGTAVGCLYYPHPRGKCWSENAALHSCSVSLTRGVRSSPPLWKQADRKGKHQGVERASSFGGLISHTLPCTVLNTVLNQEYRPWA